MKAKAIKHADNLQIPGDLKSDRELASLVKKAESGEFLPLSEHKKHMQKWIHENFR